MILKLTIGYGLLWLFHSSQSIQASQPLCPQNCACSKDSLKFSVAKCDQLPHLNEIIDVGILEIETRDSNTCPITEDLSKFSHLKNLYVSHCSANICTNSFKNLTDLQNVTFHNVSLSYLNPLLFESNRQLKMVNLSSNPLKIWRHLLISASVEEVDLSDCGMTEVPKNAFSQILNLQRLTLRNNSLKKLDVLLPTSITYLDLSNNQFENIPVRALRRLGDIKELNVSGNPLICSCGLKLLDRYMSLKNIAFFRPAKCIVAADKEAIILDELSIDDICVNLPDNKNLLPPIRSLHRIRREASKESVEDISVPLQSNMENFSSEVETIPPKPAARKENAGKNDTAETTTSAVETAPHPAVEPMIFYLIFGLIFLLLILVVVIIISLCCALADSHCKDENKMSAGTAAAVKMCQQTLARNSDETIELMSRACTTRKGTCRICPKTMRNSRNTCRSAATSATQCGCETATECSDTETVVNDCYSTNASSSACTTFERR